MPPLRRSAVQALQALLQLAQDPQVWLSVSSVAAAQELPAPMLEQQVVRSLSRRLQQALDRELLGLSLQELLFDLRSWQESLSNDGGVMLG